ncbi:MAG: threonine ammonia-lyase, biosynthetic [Gammaproteobacteria bacterium]|jgi:threonine dehydratase|nr:threonine ammonia-lyase, biosynthetic [Gammaproteobacteria bacterium]
MTDYLQRILKARVYDLAIETPLERAPRLSERLGTPVYFKREDLQPLYSFKLRGAYNKLAGMPFADVRDGVVCASAGNHAQGVALAARELNITAHIVMPVATPRIKVEAVRALGGQVMLEGANYDAAYATAVRFAQTRGLAFIHPFDDPEVIAGQGTIGMEIHRQSAGPIDSIFVPIGGGGLIAGIASYMKAVAPEVRIVGVEPADCASMTAAFAAGGPVELEDVGVFADGVAVRRVGDETYRVCRALVDDIVLVNTDEICAAIKDIYEDSRVVVEPAGALAVAGLKKVLATHRVKPAGALVAINCGANLNFDRLRHIAERAALGEQREALFAVEIPEQRGSFRRFCAALGERNITEFNYRYQNPERAVLFVGVELQDGDAERALILSQLEEAGYTVIDISANELAKLHVRYMVGGPAPALADERVYRFEFPERRGALLKFLQAVGERWNISLFHYRNHGADYGRVLAGVQVPGPDRDEFARHLSQLGYQYSEETDNPAYRMFLSPTT